MWIGSLKMMPDYCIVVIKTMSHWLVAWRSGNAFHLINKVALRRVWLVLGWVIGYGQVNYFGTKPAS